MLAAKWPPILYNKSNLNKNIGQQEIKIKTEKQQIEARDRLFGIRLMKNGYITGDRLYLTLLKYIEEYELTYPFNNRTRLRLSYIRTFSSKHMITCNGDEKFQYQIIFSTGAVYTIVILLLTLFVITGKSLFLSKGYRFVVMSAGNSGNDNDAFPELFEINDDNLHHQKIK